MNRNILLSNIDVIEICEYFQIDLIACVMKDQLKSIKRRDGAYVINLQSEEDEGNGTHWVALYIYKNSYVYWDSFGEVEPDEVLLFCQNISDNNRSYDHIQNLVSVYCGYYCIAFLYACNRRKKKTELEDIMIDFNAPFELDDTLKNLKILQFFFQQMFSRIKK